MRLGRVKLMGCACVSAGSLCVVVATTTAAQSLPEIVVSSKPVRTLVDDGSDELQFVAPRVARFTNGDWVISDARSKTVRVFPRSGTGTHLLARGGNGPGELPGAFDMQVANDSVYTFGIPPMSPAEIRLYASDSGFVRTIPARIEGQPRMTVIRRLNATTYLVKRGIGGMTLDRPPKEGIVFADSSTYGVFVLSNPSAPSSVTWMPAVLSNWYFSYPFKGSPVVPTSVDRYPFGDTISRPMPRAATSS